MATQSRVLGSIFLLFCFVTSSAASNVTFAPPFIHGSGHQTTAHAFSGPTHPLPKMVIGPKQRVTQNQVDMLQNGSPQIFLITFDDSAIETDARADRQLRHLRVDDAKVIQMKRRRFKALKDEVLAGYSDKNLHIMQQYTAVPAVLARIGNYGTYQALLNDPRVLKIFSSLPVYSQMVGSPWTGVGDSNVDWQNLISQPWALSHGYNGSGVRIAVIDSEEDVNDPGHIVDNFVPDTASDPQVSNNCNSSAPYCNIAADAYCYLDNNSNPVCSDCKYEGANLFNPVEYMDCGGVTENIVCQTLYSTGNLPLCFEPHEAMVALAAEDTAPGVKIDSITIGQSFLSDRAIGQALNYILTTKYNEVSVVNISLGSKELYSGPCSDYEEPWMKELYDEGVVIVAASGDNGAGVYSNTPQGLNSPACSPYVTSVGAVTAEYIQPNSVTPSPDFVAFPYYLPGTSDSGNCAKYYGGEPIDTTPCFSNYSSYLTLEAPGAGYSDSVYKFYAGTSLAAPVVAGAAAIIKSILPGSGIKQGSPADEIKDVLVSTADQATVQLGDDSTNLPVPRLNIEKAIGLANQLAAGAPPPPPPPSTNVSVMTVLMTYLILL